MKTDQGSGPAPDRPEAPRDASVTTIRTGRLELVLESRTELLARVAAMSPAEQAEVSPDWLARVRAATVADPWTHGFAIAELTGGAIVGGCGFKGPPDSEGVVEIAYGVSPEHQGRGYATEAAAALVDFAFRSGRVRRVRAHTRPAPSASGRVLMKCGFEYLGEVVDPEDGPVWRWEVSGRGIVGP